MKKKRAKQILAMLLSLVLIMTTVISPSATVFATTAQNATRSITLDVKSKVTMYMVSFDFVFRRMEVTPFSAALTETPVDITELSTSMIHNSTAKTLRL